MNADPEKRYDPDEVDDLNRGKTREKAGGNLARARGESEHRGGEKERRFDPVASVFDVDREARRCDDGAGDGDLFPDRSQNRRRCSSDDSGKRHHDVVVHRPDADEDVEHREENAEKKEKSRRGPSPRRAYSHSIVPGGLEVTS